MNDRPEKQGKPSNEPEAADASYLFADEGGEATPDAEPRPEVTPASGGGYEVEELDEPEPRAPVPPVPTDQPAPAARKPAPAARKPAPEPVEEDVEKPKPKSTKAKRTEAEESAVSKPWSRGAEWGSTLLVLAVAALALGWLVYATFSPESVGRLVLILAAGLVVILTLAYPIFITLERPVRMTPEQALKDFLGALSHKRPHYRRMWLLLSDRGKATGPFDGFGEFQAYWARTRSALKSKAKAGTLVFSVADFKSEKSAGQSVIDGTATIHVKAGEGEPIAAYRGKMWFVKGPDRMWYLNQGYLPEAADSAR